MSVKKNYDQWAATYDSNENKTRDLDKLVSQQTLRKYDFNSVLEIGCGTGKNTKWLMTHCSRLLGVDFSKKMLQYAQEKIIDPRVRFMQADISKPWQFTDEKFDLISCNLILEHIQDIHFIFQQAASKLNNNGLFFISEYHPFRQYLGKQARFEIDGATIMIDSHVHHISEFFDAGKENGFELLEIREWFDEIEDNNDKTPRILSLVLKNVK